MVLVFGIQVTVMMNNECTHKWHLVSHTFTNGETAGSVRAECILGCFSTARFEVKIQEGSIRHTFKTAEEFQEDYDKHKPIDSSI